MKKSLLFTLFLLIFSSICHAHQQSTAYLNLEQQTSNKLSLVGSWQASVNDLDKALNFDKNQDNVITWHEITSQQQAVLDYLNSHFNVNNVIKFVLNAMAPKLITVNLVMENVITRRPYK